MAASPQSDGHVLLRGGSNSSGATKNVAAWRMCRQYIAHKVAGVFFAPLELTVSKDEVNHRIVRALEKARIPIVLLDRCILPYPHRCAHDLVGIDNRRAGYLAAEHLLKLGARRIVFVAQPDSAPTVEAGIAGYREALYAHGCAFKPECVRRLDPFFKDEVRRMTKTLRAEAYRGRPDAQPHRARVSHSRRREDRRYGRRGIREPAACSAHHHSSALPRHWRSGHVGDARAHRTAGMLPRDILLDCRLVVRESCGSMLKS
jgi:DNA-binding LacI/PurR family transcriptional regulator